MEAACLLEHHNSHKLISKYHFPLSTMLCTTDHNSSSPPKPTVITTFKARRQRSKDLNKRNMASSSASDAQSLAATRLERQNKRIAEAEAALTAPAPPPPAVEKPRQGRGKGKQWKPFDFTTDSVAPDNFGEKASVSRVNVFRAPLGAGPFSRPVSRMSTVTTDTTTSDGKRHDSTIDDTGFQVITGKKKKPTALGAYEDSGSQYAQTSVEAPFDKREIHQVFGNELPGPDYVEQIPGSQEGQLQFVQHPNGDVAAHQWFNTAFQWQNIGHFSNIRKKIEGQLATDSLKGETAVLTLQKNTLTYFHTLAKQREANVMGSSFGLKEIQALMPDFRIVEQPTPPPKKPIISLLNAQASEYEEPPQTAVFAPRITLPTAPKAMTEQPSFAQSIASERHNPSYPTRAGRGYGGPQSQQSQNQPRHEDPFYDNYYAAYPAYPPPYAPIYQNPQSSVYGGMPTYSGYSGTMDYNYQYPSRAPNSYLDSFTESQNQYYNAQQQAHVGVESGYGQSNTSAAVPQLQRYNSFGNTLQQHRVIPQTPRGSIFQSSDRPYPATDPAPQPTANSAVFPARPKPVTPLQSRAAMREQLAGLGDKAKERSLSQANIARTVMYDPFQGQHAEAQALETEVHKVGAPLQPYSSAPSSMLPTAIPFDPASDAYFPNLAPQHTRDPSVQTAEDLSDYLKNSSPDTSWESKGVARYEIQTPPGLPARRKPRIQDFKGPFFTEQSNWLQQTLDEALSLDDRQAMYDDDLKEWWKGGDWFAKQERGFQSIMKENNKPSVLQGLAGDASSRALYGKKAPSAFPPKIFGPTGHPSTQSNDETKSIDQDLSRMLFAVAENLSSYISGPEEARRPYFQRWVQPPDWCIDLSATGNDSFYDSKPDSVRARPREDKSVAVPDVRFGDFSSPLAGGVSLGSERGGGVAASEAPKGDRFGIGEW